MNKTCDFLGSITALKNKILSGGALTSKEALDLISIPITEKGAIGSLIEAAHEITLKFASQKAQLCSLINAKSGACSEDCKFCSQSSHYNTNIDIYPLVNEAAVLKRADEIRKMGVGHFCLVTAERSLEGEAFENILELFRTLKAKTGLELDASIGILTEEQAQQLAAAGVSMVNHNLETSERYYSQVCSTHSYEERKNTIRWVKKYGMQTCAGGILGMGEAPEDRVAMAFELKALDIDVVPINILNPRSGTPLENVERIHPMEVIKTIAVFRFILPAKVIKLCGGREVNLGEEWQPLALRAGANGMIVGGYLTTGGDPVEKDFAMLAEAGYAIPQIADRR